MVGSLVHADPAAELPAVLVLLGGTMELASAGNGGPRRVAAADFFLGPLESALRPGELATAAVFPRPPAGTGSAWLELARRHGDYALCGVGVLVTLDEGLRVAAGPGGPDLGRAGAGAGRPDRRPRPASPTTPPTGPPPGAWPRRPSTPRTTSTPPPPTAATWPGC